MVILSQSKNYGKVKYTLNKVVNTKKQASTLKKRLSKTNSVRVVHGKDGSGKMKYGIYTAWKK